MPEKLIALFGGEKTIKQDGPHFVWPKITADTEEAVKKQLYESISIYDNSGVIGRLENALSKIFCRKTLLTNSGTCALYSMFVGAQFTRDDEVICPTYTFFATVTPLFFTGAIPILADCDTEGNIDPEDIKRRITKKTKAILITHMWGNPCNMKKIVEIAQKHRLLLLEDISHSFGATYEGKLVGTFGDAAACSLQGQKTLTGGEGGFLLSHSDEFIYRALLLGHYNKRCKNEISSTDKLAKFSLTGMGLKFRIHPLAAAVAEEQLTKINTILKGRRKIAEILIKGLSGVKGIEVPKLGSEKESSWYAFILKYKSEELGGLSREKFYESLEAEGCTEIDIPSSTSPLHLINLFQNPEELFPEYASKLNYKKGDFPNAEKFHESILKLPVWYEEQDIKIVNQYIQAMKKVSEYYTSQMFKK